MSGEGIWSARVGDDLYEVRNSPWHSTDINYLDVVRAVAPEDGMKPVVIEVVHRRGHRTIQVIFLEEGMDQKEGIIERVKELGGTYEGAHSTLYAIDIKPEVDFDPIADYLEECEGQGYLSYRHALQPQSMGTGDVIH